MNKNPNLFYFCYFCLICILCSLYLPDVFCFQLQYLIYFSLLCMVLLSINFLRNVTFTEELTIEFANHSSVVQGSCLIFFDCSRTKGSEWQSRCMENYRRGPWDYATACQLCFLGGGWRCWDVWGQREHWLSTGICLGSLQVRSYSCKGGICKQEEN